MPSESVSSFLELAKSNRLLPPDQVDDLVRQPDAPQDSLAALCDFLRDRGVITRYQADLIRAGKGYELNFAGYPVTDEIGPCPGGTAFAVLHPSLRTPLVLRRLRVDWLPPADNVAAFVGRAQAAAPLTHPNLTHLLDAGVYRDEPFVALEPFDGSDLGTLVTDIGAMPAVLAAAYARLVALGLAAAHEKGLAHGDVRPGNVVVGPLVRMSRPRADGSPRFRPAATATVRLTEFGLVPRRPPATRWAEHDPDLPAEVVAYLPPERVDGDEATPAGDVYGLGATIYFLLTGRPPYQEATAAEVMGALRAGSPTPLDALRPDAPADLVGLVKELMAADPVARPTAAAAADRLARSAPPCSPPAAVPLTPAVEPALPPPEPAPDGRPSGGWVAVPVDGPADPNSPTYTPAAYPGWASEGELPTAGHHHPGFLDPAADSPAPVRRAEEKPGRVWVWVAVGAGLQILAILLWVVFFVLPGCSNGGDQPKPQRKASG
jgi:serine/threonine protein kinase